MTFILFLIIGFFHFNIIQTQSAFLPEPQNIKRLLTSLSDTQINTYTPNNQDDPTLCILADGSIVIAWEDSARDGSSSGIYYKKFTKTGSMVIDDTLVNT